MILPNHRTKCPAPDRTNTVIGKTTVLRRKPRSTNYNRYDCKCGECGGIFIMSEMTIALAIEKGTHGGCDDCRKLESPTKQKDRTCVGCGEYLPHDAVHFFKCKKNASGLERRCKRCHGFAYGEEPEYRPAPTKPIERPNRRKGKGCKTCEGYPWRREFPVCIECGEPCGQEAPLRAVEFMFSRDAAREVV